MTTDSQGREILPGHAVAYNMSGRVVPGIVADVIDSYILVRYTGEHTARYHWHTGELMRHEPKLGHVSKVRDGSSMLVLL